MLELTKKEAQRLWRTLDWVLAATLDSQDSRQELITIRDKITNVIKCAPKEERFSIFLSSEDETR